jgi:hypothetical protein
MKTIEDDIYQLCKQQFINSYLLRLQYYLPDFIMANCAPLQCSGWMFRSVDVMNSEDDKFVLGILVLGKGEQYYRIVYRIYEHQIWKTEYRCNLLEDIQKHFKNETKQLNNINPHHSTGQS